MSIQQTKKQSDVLQQQKARSSSEARDSYLEKRLKLIRQQVYGKNTSQNINIPQNNQTINMNVKSDVSYLSYDLLKISILASIAIGAELILYYLKVF